MPRLEKLSLGTQAKNNQATSCFVAVRAYSPCMISYNMIYFF